MKSYLKMDFYRMLTSKYFGIGILGVVGVYGLSLMQLKSQDVYLLNYSVNNSDYLQKARKYGHFTGYKN